MLQVLVVLTCIIGYLDAVYSGAEQRAPRLTTTSRSIVHSLGFGHKPIHFNNYRDHYDYEDTTPRPFSLKLNDEPNEELQEHDFEPLVPLPVPKEKEKLQVQVRSIQCDNFARYATNCTLTAAVIYNSSRKTPPLPSKIAHWCKAIRHLTNCAIDWNTDCKDVTDDHFNEDSIKGHLHVLGNICEDQWFLGRYAELFLCINSTATHWENCYLTFKMVVEEQKNSTRDWTHYETHFYLCCARAQFRRCTLNALFNRPTNCTQDQAVVLQKFSSIVSEGDVYQDCELNMLYPSCPGGDPRPSTAMLSKLMGTDISAAPRQRAPVFVVTLIILYYS
ncbi:uncharacterized protein [Choristoneura fumiferana]|uniref:uncharacterized protein n=1 Tax=Choristoneura fumiferana TaxID=7141 RepID=UPI003D155806